MHTLRLRVSDKIYDKLIWLLSKFNKQELEIIQEDKEFLKNQKYLQKELDEINSEDSKFLSIDEVNDSLDKIIILRN